MEGFFYFLKGAVIKLSILKIKEGSDMYNAIELSKYIVSKCVHDKCPISNLQLQKILYYIQKDFLSRGNPIFGDAVEAWQFGPVVPNVYYYFCGFGAMPITTAYDNISVMNNDKKYIDPIVEKKRILNPWDMVDETHKKDGAWDVTYKNGNGNHDIISVGLIKKLG